MRVLLNVKLTGFEVVEIPSYDWLTNSRHREGGNAIICGVTSTKSCRHVYNMRRCHPQPLTPSLEAQIPLIRRKYIQSKGVSSLQVSSAIPESDSRTLLSRPSTPHSDTGIGHDLLSKGDSGLRVTNNGTAISTPSITEGLVDILKLWMSLKICRCSFSQHKASLRILLKSAEHIFLIVSATMREEDG